MKRTPNRERSGLASPRGLTAPRRTLRQLLIPNELSQRLAVDCAAWFVAVASGATVMGASFAHGAVVGGAAGCLQVAIGTATGLYRGHWRVSSFDESVALTGVSTLVTAAVGLIVALASALQVTLAVGLFAPFTALACMLASRGIRRFAKERRWHTVSRVSATPVIVFGAGDAGAQLVRAMLTNPMSHYTPVAILDDDPAKRHLRICGVPVLGSRGDLARVAGSTESTVLVIAIPSAGGSTIFTLEDAATEIGLDVRVLPPTQELIDGIVNLSDLREVSEADLLGRRMIDTDIDAIGSYLSNARVLVTGAGGSIGSELCRQIARFNPSELIMVDRDESALHSVQLSIEGRALLQSRNLVIADIRDGDRIAQVFSEHKPDVVFHAAALKHLPLLEMYAEEGWKTNVLGTNHVLRAASLVGVRHFVNVSTDKAADPTSVLGYTKRVAEGLTSWYAHRSRGDWVSVRFGNVLGSRGSVLEAFRAQVDAGGPITVTHPEVARYFMTPQEACQLVIQAGAVGHRGEALVLDMGEPVKIVDVARRLAEAAPYPVEIEFTGLRPGEKLHETLVSEGELDIRRSHPLISHVVVPALSPSMLGLFDSKNNDAARESMASLCSLDQYTEAIAL